MTFTDEQLAQVADELDTGMITYLHRKTGEIKAHPDPDSPYFEGEFWEEVIDEVEKDIDNYFRLEPMASHEAFRIMEDFANSLDLSPLKGQLITALSQRKSFQNFGHIIHDSDQRQNWFAFKKAAQIDWVKQELEWQLED